MANIPFPPTSGTALLLRCARPAVSLIPKEARPFFVGFLEMGEYGRKLLFCTRKRYSISHHALLLIRPLYVGSLCHHSVDFAQVFFGVSVPLGDRS